MREHVLELLRRARPDLVIKAGSPLETSFIDPLAAILPVLDRKLSDRYQISVEDKANLFLLGRDEGENSEIIVRLYFISPEELNYGAGLMTFTTSAGVVMANKYAVVVPTSEMAIYTDDDYYYSDITLEGEGTFNPGDTLDWDSPTTNFSFLAVTSTLIGGHLPETDTELDERIDHECILRNIGSLPGAEAWLEDQFPGMIRDAYAVGFGDTKMERDVIGTTHVGGYVDLYVKEDLPVEKTYTFDVAPLTDAIYTRSIGIVFDDAAQDLYFQNILAATDAAFTATSQVRATITTPGSGFSFVEGVAADFTVNRTTGVVTMGAGNIIADAASWQDGDLDMDAINNRLVVWGGGALDLTEYIFPNMLVEVSSSIGANPLWYLVISVTANNFTLDRDVPAALYGSEVNIRRFEPVQFDFSYNPLGIKLSDLERPVMWVNTLTEIDPLTEEPYDPTITVTRIGGFGTGVYGAGPYGFSDIDGWMLSIVDENYRYSNEEDGCIELVGGYLGSRIQVNYLSVPNIDSIQDSVDSQRAMSAHTLVKAFTPVSVTINVDVEVETGITEITGMEEYIWGLANRIELSDIIKELYARGATYVDLDDLISGSVFEKWNIDGSFVTLVPSAAGVLDIGDETSRFMPISITINIPSTISVP